MNDKIPAARGLTPEQNADVQKKLDQITDALNGLRFAVEEVQALLTPCYGAKDGESCYLPDHHRGRHMSVSGTEWYDED